MASNSDESEPASNADRYIEIMKDLSHKLEKGLTPYLKEGEDELKQEIKCTVQREFYGDEKDVNIKRILNPLKYAWELHEEYMKMMPENIKILFVGMNPSTESITGIPFYQEQAMTELFGSDRLMELENSIHTPYNDQAVYDYTSESGDRFWKFMTEKFGSVKEFYRHCFVINYCPLIFIKDDGGNEIINGFNGSKEELLDIPLMHDCNESLQKLTEHLIPRLLTGMKTTDCSKLQSIVGIGWFAHNRFLYSEMHEKISDSLHRIDHPSPIHFEEYEGWRTKVEDQLNISAWVEITKELEEKKIGNTMRRLSVVDS